jgi:DNA-binding NarL/FixJ family response regulator
LSALGANASTGGDLVFLPHSEIVRRSHAKDLDDFQIRVPGSIASGLTDREIAAALRVSLHRIRYAVRDLIAKLSARTRAEAVFVTVTAGLLDGSDADLEDLGVGPPRHTCARE